MTMFESSSFAKSAFVGRCLFRSFLLFSLTWLFRRNGDVTTEMWPGPALKFKFFETLDATIDKQQHVFQVVK